MTDLVRFSVAIPEDLLMAFDAYVAKRGVTKNRSEVVRDLIRDALVEEEWDMPGRDTVATLSLVFDITNKELLRKLEGLKSENREHIVSTMRVYLDECECMETMILRGEGDLVDSIANSILGIKGVRHGHMAKTCTSKFS